MLSNLVDVGDRSVVNNYLEIFSFIGRNNTSENVDQGSLSCSIMSKNAHELITFNLKSETFQGFHFLTSSKQPWKGFRKIFDSHAIYWKMLFWIVDDSVSFSDSWLFLICQGETCFFMYAFFFYHFW